VQDKTWVHGPDNAWEFYTVLGDAPSMACDLSGPTGCVGDVEAVESEAGSGTTSACC